VGFADGTIAAVDPGTLHTTPVASVDGRPIWLSLPPSRKAVALAPAAVAWIVAAVSSPTGRGPVTVHDLGRRRRHSLPRYASAFLLDGRGRLWLGEDRGEWGGAVSVLDLGTGQRRDIEPPRSGELKSWSGVYGFVENGKGRVLAYGGLIHMGHADAFVARVDGGAARILYRADEPARAARPRPVLPITHIVPDLGNERLIVFSYADVYTVDRALRRWKWRTAVNLSYVPGRPDAMSSYPALRRVLPRPRAQTARADALPDYLLVTSRDGHVLLQGGAARPQALPGQLGQLFTEDLVGTPVGPLLVSDPMEGPQGWRLEKDGWKEVPLGPPVRTHADDPLAGQVPKTWREVRVLGSADQARYVVSGGWSGPGTLAVDRWDARGFTAVATTLTTISPMSCFLTPDGTLWAWEDGLHVLAIDGKSWQAVRGQGQASGGAQDDSAGSHGLAVVVRGHRRPPFILHEPARHRLLRLVPHGDGSASFAPLGRGEAGRPLEVLSAIADGDQLLIATSRGLRRLDPVTGLLSAHGAPAVDNISSLARDGQGRVWLAGRGLFLSEDAMGTSLVAVSGPPPLARGSLRLLGADPGEPDTMMVGVDGGGGGVISIAVH
jgi:hypothetical protein